MAQSLKIWCSENPSAILRPDDDLVKNGFKPTTSGNNYWLNYLFNYLTSHVQLPAGSLTSSFKPTLDGHLSCEGVQTIGKSGATYSGDVYLDLYATIWPLSSDKVGASYDVDWANDVAIHLPNLEGCVLVGQKSAPSVFSNIFTKVGAEEIALTDTQLPAVTLQVIDHGHHHGFTSLQATTTIDYEDGSYGMDSKTTNTASATTGVTVNPFGNLTNAGGVADAHSNIQPSMVTYWHIKY